MQVRCDRCSEIFAPILKEDKGYQWFRCPKCDKIYPVVMISPRGVQLREELNRKKEYYRNAELSVEEAEKLFKEICDLQEEFKKECTPLPATH